MGEISLLSYPLMKELAESEPCVAERCWAQLWAPTWHWGWDGVRTSSVCFPGEGGACCHWTCSFQVFWLCALCTSPSGVSSRCVDPHLLHLPLSVQPSKNTSFFFPFFVSQAPDSKSNCMKREAFSTSHPTQIVSILIPNLLDKVFESCCFYCNMSIRKNSSSQ